MVERAAWDGEVAGSIPVTPTVVMAQWYSNGLWARDLWVQVPLATLKILAAINKLNSNQLLIGQKVS